MTTPRRRTALFLLNILYLLSAAAAAVDDAELTLMCRVLRSNGYNLFCNAIATSDLQFQLASTADASINTTSDSGSSIIATAGAAAFTLFAPKDTFLYTLDIASDAADYIAALRYHIVPNRLLTLSDLHNLSSPFLDTLLPHYSILIYKTDNKSVTVDGVMLLDPDLFLGSSIAVHGLNGILLNGYSQPFEDCDGENGTEFISSPDAVNSPNFCLNSPAETPTPTPTVPPPIPAEDRGKRSRNVKKGLNSPAASPAPNLTVPPPISAEKGGKGSKNAKGLNSPTATPAPNTTVPPPLSAENGGQSSKRGPSSPVAAQALNLTVPPPTSEENRGNGSKNAKRGLNPPAATPAGNAKVSPPIPAENRGKYSRNMKRVKHHRGEIGSVPRRDRRRSNNPKGRGDDL